MDPKNLIATLGLSPHPEGGYFRATYRSSQLVKDLPQEFSGPRAASTAIYYLLPAGARSAFHRIRSDEIWHFYKGGPLKIVEIDPDGVT